MDSAVPGSMKLYWK